MTDKELMEQALEALIRLCTLLDDLPKSVTDAMASLGERLAREEQEDRCANCGRPQHEHRGNDCPKPYTTIWHAWDYDTAPQPADPVVGTKTWIDEDNKLITRELKHSEVYKQPEDKPVATVTSETGADITMSWWHEPALPVGTPLYTRPQPAAWVALTDEEQRNFAQAMDAEPLAGGWSELVKFARAIEAKLKEKNAP